MKTSRLRTLTSRALILIWICVLLFTVQTPALAQKNGQPRPEDLPTIPPLLPPPDLNAIIQQAGPNDPIPVIVQYIQTPGKSEIDLENDMRNQVGDFQADYRYKRILYGMAGRFTSDQIKALSKLPFVKSVDYDAPVHAFLDGATHWFGVQHARTDFGVTGRGISVAVIDTGIDPNHVDLDGGKIVGWKDLINGNNFPYDDHGHGTHVASIAAGTGEGNPAYKGVAPEASLVGVKVLNNFGFGSISGVTAGVEWCVQNKDNINPKIRVINLSLGASGSSDGTDPLSVSVNNAVDAGLVVCVAAGNSGPSERTIGTPAAAEKVITVGAMADVAEKGFYQAKFSSRGPTADARIKPDLSAPGVNITAANKGTTNGYVNFSGTSMATPFVAGVVALILERSPDLTPFQVKDRIKSKSIDWGIIGFDIDYGAGRLDAYTTVGNVTTSKPAVPSHKHIADSLMGTGNSDWWDIKVTNTSFPIAITLIMPTWKSFSDPDFDIFLYPPDGSYAVAGSTGVNRQDQIGYQPTVTGTWRLQVYSFAGSGPYFFDQSSSIPITLSVETKHPTVDLKSVFTANIKVEEALNLAGFQFDLRFNSEILEVMDVVEGDFLKSNNGNTSFFPPKMDNAKGLASGIVNIRMGVGGVDRNGTLAEVKFIAKGKGNSFINLQNVILSDPSTQTIIPLLKNGQINVNPFPAWDINQDNAVNLLDFVIVGQNFGRKEGEVGFNPRADVNRDGSVDVFDLILVAQHFGETTSPAAPPITFESLNPDQIATLEKIYQIMDKMPNSDPDFLRIKELLRHLILLLSPNQITQTRVLQNYPNPFNPETWIPFELATEAKVTITIYNALGQLVRTIDLGEKLRGSYVSKESAVYWDGRNDFGESVAGGVYFYRLQAGKFSAVKKMILIK